MPYYKQGHEVGFGVAHFLECVRQPFVKQKSTFQVIISSIGLPVRFSFPCKFQVDVETLSKEKKPVGLLSLTTHFLAERDGLTMAAAFRRVVSQVGWQATSCDFEGQIPKRTFTEPQIFLRSSPSLSDVKKWCEARPAMSIPGHLGETARRLDLF